MFLLKFTSNQVSCTSCVIIFVLFLLVGNLSVKASITGKVINTKTPSMYQPVRAVNVISVKMGYIRDFINTWG